MAVAPVPAYAAVSVTLADTNPQNLLTAMQAIDARLAGVLHVCCSLAIQADDSNGANQVLIGDVNVSPTRMGYRLSVHDQYVYHSVTNMNVPLSQIYIEATAAPCIVNVEVTFL